MAKKTGKRTVTCGKCGKKGHNARSCKLDSAPSKAEVKKSSVTKTVTEVPDPPVTSKSKTAPKVEVAPDESRPRRPAPTADRGTAATASPYRCPKCNSVAILVIVRVKDHNKSFRKGHDVYTGQIRCEECLNKPDPADLILKWGAQPGETVSSETANASVDA